MATPDVLTPGEWAAGRSRVGPAPCCVGFGWTESMGLGREDSGVSVLGLAERVGQGAWSPRMPRLLSVCLRRKLTTAIDY